MQVIIQIFSAAITRFNSDWLTIAKFKLSNRSGALETPKTPVHVGCSVNRAPVVVQYFESEFKVGQALG